MSFLGYDGALTAAPEELTNCESQQEAYLGPADLVTDVVLPFSAPTAPRQPKEDDAAAAFPETVAATCNSGSLRSSSSTISSPSDSCDSIRPKYSSSAGADATEDTQAARRDNMVATESLVAAGPAATIAKTPSKLSWLVRRVFTTNSNKSSTSARYQQHLLLPCLLGDPFACLSVDRRVGISAGTLLGRLSLFYWPEAPNSQQFQEGTSFGQLLLPQAYSDDGVSICWMDSSYVTAIMGASDVSRAGEITGTSFASDA